MINCNITIKKNIRLKPKPNDFTLLFKNFLCAIVINNNMMIALYNKHICIVK